MFTSEQIERVKSECSKRMSDETIFKIATGKSIHEWVENDWPFKEVSYTDVFDINVDAVVKEFQSRGGFNPNLIPIEYYNGDGDEECYLTSYLHENHPAARGYTYLQFQMWREHSILCLEDRIETYLKEEIRPLLRKKPRVE